MKIPKSRIQQICYAFVMTGHVEFCAEEFSITEPMIRHIIYNYMGNDDNRDYIEGVAAME